MPVDAWLPVGHSLPDGACLRLVIDEGIDWQIFSVTGGGNALVVKASLVSKWIQSGLVDSGTFSEFGFGDQCLCEFSSGESHVLSQVIGCKSPDSKSEVLAFADALRKSRLVDSESGFQDSIYLEKLSRLLPTFSLSQRISDEQLFGTWLTGGIPVPVTSFRRLRSIVSWLGEPQLREVIERAGFSVPGAGAAASFAPSRSEGMQEVEGLQQGMEQGESMRFVLAGRPMLENFLNEHVIDIVENEERYKALGINFPSAIILHGPPGCGKTFAVERLIEYLGWPSFQIEASSVASPYIHETSKKVAAVFDQAMKAAPAVLVIDEMEAFLADRQSGAGSSHHRVEEVAEFLRRIPEAINNQVLIVAMTNRIDMIDPAILRRGRFDHVISVGMASEQEVAALLNKLVGDLPQVPGIDVASLAARLTGRPLSDVAFIVREGARLAARAGKDKLDQDSLQRALEASPARDADSQAHRKIGFT